MNAREEILTRIRTALADVPAGLTPEEDVPVTWRYGQPLATPDVVADFVEKVEDYEATVVRVPADGLVDAIGAAVQALGTTALVAPAGLDEAWLDAVRASGVEVRRDDPVLSHAELNAIDTVLTTCAVGMADSGTIALDHGTGQGRRALTLLPDRHIVVIRRDQVVSDVPEGLVRLGDALRARQPVTWLSGGSATSDIELSRVEGVHGPRTLYVILADS